MVWCGMKRKPSSNRQCALCLGNLSEIKIFPIQFTIISLALQWFDTLRPNQMAAILQTTLLNSFSLMKTVLLLLKFQISAITFLGKVYHNSLKCPICTYCAIPMPPRMLFMSLPLVCLTSTACGVNVCINEIIANPTNASKWVRKFMWVKPVLHSLYHTP